MKDFFSHPVVQFGIASAIVTGLWALAYWKGTVDTKLGDHMKEIRDKLADILQRLPPAQPTVAVNSPRQLTDFGREIAGRLDAVAWASAQAPNLAARGAGKQPFEIDLLAREYVTLHLDAEMRDRIAACAYEFGIDRSSVTDVLQVVLRDDLIGRIQQPAERQTGTG